MPSSHKRRHRPYSSSSSRRRPKLRHPPLDSVSAQHLRSRLRTLLLATPSSSTQRNMGNKCSNTRSIRSTPNIFSSSNSSSSTKLGPHLPKLTQARPAPHLCR